MITRVFAIHDLKAGFFMQPFLFPSIGQAVRAVQDLVSDPSTMLARHPSDFVLYELGNWDDSNGQYQMLPVFNNLGSVVSFLPTSPSAFVGDPQS